MKIAFGKYEFIKIPSVMFVLEKSTLLPLTKFRFAADKFALTKSASVIKDFTRLIPNIEEF